MVDFHKKELSPVNAWFFSFAIIAIGYYPLINDRIYLVDDITRSINGYFGWFGLGRPLTEWLAIILSTSSSRLADITPMPQLLSIVALTYLTKILIKNIFNKITIGNVLICITVAVNPLVLGNMLFRFDSLSMILSMLLSVMAWDLINKDKALYALAALIACLSFYQPAISIFPLLVIIKFIQSKEDNDKTFGYIVKSAAISVISCLIYYFLVVKHTIKETTKRAELTTGLSSTIYDGIKTSVSTALQSYGRIACILISISAIIFIFVYMKHFKNIAKSNPSKTKYITIALMVMVPIIIALCTAGVNLILSNGYYPTRVLFPIAFIIFMMLAIPAAFSNSLNCAASCLSIAMIFTSTSAIYATASSLYHQQRYDSYVLFSLSEKLSSLNSDKNTYIFGATESSKASKTSTRVFPGLGYIDNNYYDMTLSQSLINNGIRNIKFSGQDRKTSYDLEEMACNGDMSLIYSMPQYSIFENDKSLLIYLGGDVCNKQHNR